MMCCDKQANLQRIIRAVVPDLVSVE